MSDDHPAMTEPTAAPADQNSPRRPRPSLKAQFIILLCLAMGPAAVIGFLETSAAFRRQAEKTDEAILQAARISVLDDRQVIAGARVLLDSLAEQYDIKQARSANCRENLRKAIVRSPDFESLAISDETGKPVCTTQ